LRDRAGGLRPRAELGTPLALGRRRLDGRRLARGARHDLVAAEVDRERAVEERRHLLARDRLVAEEALGDAVEAVAVLGDQVLGALVGPIDELLHLGVDLLRRLLGVVLRARDLAAEEDGVLLL